MLTCMFVWRALLTMSYCGEYMLFDGLTALFQFGRRNVELLPYRLLDTKRYGKQFPRFAADAFSQ